MRLTSSLVLTALVCGPGLVAVADDAGSSAAPAFVQEGVVAPSGGRLVPLGDLAPGRLSYSSLDNVARGGLTGAPVAAKDVAVLNHGVMRSDGTAVALDAATSYDYSLPSLTYSGVRLRSAAQVGRAPLAGGTTPAVGVTTDGRLVGSSAASVPSPPTGFAAVTAGTSRFYALGNDGVIVGFATDGTLGAPCPDALQPAAGTTYVAVNASTDAWMALRSDGAVVACGYGADPNTAQWLGGGSPFVGVDAGAAYGLAARADGTIERIGTGGPAVVQPPAGHRVVSLSAGAQTGVAVLDDGTLHQWGAPLAVPAVPAGTDRYISVAELSDGQVYAIWAHELLSATATLTALDSPHLGETGHLSVDVSSPDGVTDGYLCWWEEGAGNVHCGVPVTGGKATFDVPTIVDGNAPWPGGHAFGVRFVSALATGSDAWQHLWVRDPAVSTLTVDLPTTLQARARADAAMTMTAEDATAIHGSLELRAVNGADDRTVTNSLRDDTLIAAGPLTGGTTTLPVDTTSLMPGTHQIVGHFIPDQDEPTAEAWWDGALTVTAIPTSVTMPYSIPTEVMAGHDAEIYWTNADVDATGVSGQYTLALDGTDVTTLWVPSGGRYPTYPTIPGALLTPGAHTLTLRVDPYNAQYLPSSVSRALTVDPPVVPLGTVDVVGSPVVGAALTAVPSGWHDGTQLTYQWCADQVPIPGATGATFVPTGQQVGKALQVRTSGSIPGWTTNTAISDVSGPLRSADAQISYQGHVQNIGWQPWVWGGDDAGTVGQGLRVEALRFRLNDPAYPGGITAQAHVQDIGWMAPVSDGGLVGTEGQSKRVEAFKIRLTGEMADHYDIYYRTHAEEFGWLGWAKNGEPSGTAGYSYRLEAVEVRLVPKGDPAPGAGGPAFIDWSVNAQLAYQGHVQNIGWQGWVSGGQPAGTTGQGLRVEALRFALTNPQYPGDIVAQAHVQDIGWMTPVGAGGLVGTEGQSKRVEAFTIRLTGQMADHYDIYYRTHAQTFGWLGWAKNGEPSGTAGFSYRLEAVEVRLVPKGGPAPSSTVQGVFFQQ